MTFTEDELNKAFQRFGVDREAIKKALEGEAGAGTQPSPEEQSRIEAKALLEKAVGYALEKGSISEDQSKQITGVLNPAPAAGGEGGEGGAAKPEDEGKQEIEEGLKKALTSEIGGLKDEFSAMTKALISDLATAVKQSADSNKAGLDAITSRFDALSAKVEDLEKKTPLQFKSLFSGAVPIMKKAFELDEATGKKVLSKSQHRNEILGLLEEKASTDKRYENDMLRFEQTGMLNKGIIDELSARDNVAIID